MRFFLIATAIPLVTTNGLYRTQWKCSHYATMTTSPTPIQAIMSKNKLQSQITQCERALTVFKCGLSFQRHMWFWPIQLISCIHFMSSSVHVDVPGCSWMWRSFAITDIQLIYIIVLNCSRSYVKSCLKKHFWETKVTTIINWMHPKFPYTFSLYHLMVQKWSVKESIINV